MNSRKLVKWIELILFSILLAFFIPVIFNWIQSGSLEFSSSGIPSALFLGIFIPVVILLAKNIKNDFLIAFIALLLLFIFLLFTGLSFYV